MPLFQFKLGKHSKIQHSTLYPWLQLIILKVLLKHDLGENEGGRTDERQWELYNAKPQRSKVHPPQGNHLMREDPSGDFDGVWSYAVDVTPFINGKRLATDKENFGPEQMGQFMYFLGILKAEADRALEGTGWEIRLGANWDMDYEVLTDQDFDDLFHIELVWRGR